MEAAQPMEQEAAPMQPPMQPPQPAEPLPAPPLAPQPSPQRTPSSRHHHRRSSLSPHSTPRSSPHSTPMPENPLAWDKVKMAKMGRQELFPVYMLYGNVELDVKSSPENWLLVALLPVAWVFSTKRE